MRVGDPHVKVSNLEESRALMNFVLETAKKEGVQRIEILGDSFHHHAVLRLEVIQFWEEWLVKLSNQLTTIVLEGNHDQSGDYSSEYSALTIFQSLNRHNLIVVTKPISINKIGYIPYTHDGEKFIKIANELADTGVTFLVCHQTIMGSKYESGIYASDGIDSERIDKRIVRILSGHIHTTQEFGRIEYPGTARWDSVSDANLQKGIWLYEHEVQTENIVARRFISTESVCSPLLLFRYEEGGLEPAIPDKCRATVELVGTSNWIAKEKLKFKGKAKIQTSITDAQKLVDRKSGSSLEDFVKNIFVTTMDRDRLLAVFKELSIVG